MGLPSRVLRVHYFPHEGAELHAKIHLVELEEAVLPPVSANVRVR
jgi:hypothetical protein